MDVLFRDTFIKQEPGESPNDRNDRAIRVGTAWYKQRLPQMKIYLLTNDADNRRKALSEHLDAMSVQVTPLVTPLVTRRPFLPPLPPPFFKQ